MTQPAAKNRSDPPPRIALARDDAPSIVPGMAVTHGMADGAVGVTDAGGPERNPDGVADWLRLLSRLLKLPEVQRRAIIDELHSHIRDRARDLMLGGEDEARAIQTAISELGDAAALAQRFAAANKSPRRRMLMNIGVFGVAGVALVTSIVALNGGATPSLSPRGTAYEPRPTASAPQPEARPSGNRVGTIEMTDAKLAEACEAIAASQKANARLHWGELQSVGLDAENRVTIKALNPDVAGAFALLNDAIGTNLQGAIIDFRLADGVLEVASRAFFDKRECVLMSYDISDLHEQAIDDEKLTQLVQELVEPELWKDNGGDVASIHVLGERLFAKAPPRMQRMVAWVIDQLAAGKAETPPAPGARTKEGVPVLGDVPIINHLFKPGAAKPDHPDAPAARQPAMVSIPLSHTPADAMRDVLGTVLNIDPALKTCEVERRLSVDSRTNTLIVVATADQVGPIERIVRHMDQEKPASDPARAASKSFKLTRLSADGVRKILGGWFNACPGMKQCAVPRVMEVDDDTLTITCTPGQLACIERLVAVLDEPPAVPSKAGR